MPYRYLSALLSILCFFFLAPGLLRAASKPDNSFYAAVPAAYMEDPRRNEWQKPELVLDHLFIRPGDTVADIGAGTGYFSVRLAERVGKNGTVFAADIDTDMIAILKKRVQQSGLSNLQPILSAANDPKLPEVLLDTIFICDTYLFFDDRVSYLSRLSRYLKPGGQLAILSFNYNADIPGAPPRQKMISQGTTVEEAKKAGFILDAIYFFLPFQDYLVFKKR